MILTHFETRIKRFPSTSPEEQSSREARQASDRRQQLQPLRRPPASLNAHRPASATTAGTLATQAICDSFEKHSSMLSEQSPTA